MEDEGGRRGRKGRWAVGRWRTREEEGREEQVVTGVMGLEVAMLRFGNRLGKKVQGHVEGRKVQFWSACCM